MIVRHTPSLKRIAMDPRKNPYAPGAKPPALVGRGRQIESFGILLERLENGYVEQSMICLLYTSPSPRDRQKSRMPSSA